MKNERNVGLTIVGLLLWVSCTGEAAEEKKPENITPTGFVKSLIWADEFNNDGAPDPAKWSYEMGYMRNNEVQGYTNDPKNVRVESGQLIIESRLEEWKYGDRTFDYTSGSINTQGKVYFEGDFRIEVFAKLPSGKGIWPAIWMMGKEYKWPQCTELDVMEFVGSNPNVVHGTMHWATNQNIKQSKGTKTTVYDLHTKYHLYGIERVGSNIKLFIDNNYFMDFDVPQDAYQKSFTQPLYLLLNTAMGGNWAGEVDDTVLPQRYLIDYVRVYSLKKR